jgi:hypothetical protein
MAGMAHDSWTMGGVVGAGVGVGVGAGRRAWAQDGRTAG